MKPFTDRTPSLRTNRQGVCFIQEPVREHHSVWMARCRPGGYLGRNKRLEYLVEDHRQAEAAQ